MPEKQENIVAVRTKESISRTFLSLLSTHDYEKITVTEICKGADIVRKTFYNNFRSKDDVVHHLINDIFHTIESRVDLQNMTVHEILLVAFQFVWNNQEPLLLFYNRGLLRFAHKSIVAYITEDHILAKLDKEKIDARAYRYIAAQISAVLIAVIETWIENGFEESVESLTELTEAMMYNPNPVL